MNWLKNFWQSTKSRSWLKWVNRALWGGALLGVLSGLIIIAVVAKSDLPSFTELENPQYDLASIIYDANNIPFGKYYIENREFISFNDLS